MRTEICRLAALGKLPSETAPPSLIAERELLVRSLAAPVSLDEAQALATVLGDDDCFGLAWTLIHLIESAPGWNADHVPSGSSPWLATLRSRIANQSTEFDGA
jgi:hypothetical protein